MGFSVNIFTSISMMFLFQDLVEFSQKHEIQLLTHADPKGGNPSTPSCINEQTSFLKYTARFDSQTQKLEPHCITKQTAPQESTVQ